MTNSKRTIDLSNSLKENFMHFFDLLKDSDCLNEQQRAFVEEFIKQGTNFGYELLLESGPLTFSIIFCNKKQKLYPEEDLYLDCDINFKTKKIYLKNVQNERIETNAPSSFWDALNNLLGTYGYNTQKDYSEPESAVHHYTSYDYSDALPDDIQLPDEASQKPSGKNQETPTYEVFYNLDMANSIMRALVLETGFKKKDVITKFVKQAISFDETFLLFFKDHIDLYCSVKVNNKAQAQSISIYADLMGSSQMNITFKDKSSSTMRDLPTNFLSFLSDLMKEYDKSKWFSIDH